MASVRRNGGPLQAPPVVGEVGWGGRIRTFNLLIQSQLRYRCATPQGRPAAHFRWPHDQAGRYGRSEPFGARPSSIGGAISMDSEGGAPISRSKVICSSSFAR